MQVKVMVVPVSPGVLGLEDRREGHGAYHHDDAAQVQVMDDGMEVTVGQRPATVLSLSQLPPQWWQPGPDSEWCQTAIEHLVTLPEWQVLAPHCCCRSGDNMGPARECCGW